MAFASVTRWSSLAWALGLFLGACGPGGEAPLAQGPSTHATQRSAIIGGTLDFADPAVVYYGTPSSYCTATLVAPRTLLTAAHCVGMTDPKAIFGHDPQASTRKVSVLQEVKHPDYPKLPRDVAMIELAEAVTDIAPVPMNKTPLSQLPVVGATLRQVGYGRGGGGVKNEVSLIISGVGDNSIYFKGANKQLCFGDSGGPGLVFIGGKEHVTGVASYVDSNACDNLSFDARVDVSFDFISKTMATWEGGACGQDGVCMPTCTVKDPDCRALKAPCDHAAQCEFRACRPDAQHLPYCTQPCSGPGAGNCPSGMTCSDGACKQAQLPVRSAGEACGPEVFCEDFGVCVNEGAQSVCRAKCSADGTCAAGSCVSDAASPYCLPSATPPEPPRGCTSSTGAPLALLALLLPGRRLLLQRRW